MDYDEITRDAGEAFDGAVRKARRDAERDGGSFVRHRAAEAAARSAISETVGRMTDADLLSVTASRPALLHYDPEASGPIPTPGEALRGSLRRSLLTGLQGAIREAVADGQTPDSLPEAVEAALRTMDEAVARGEPFRDAKDVREHLEDLDRDFGLSHGMASHLARFLADAGHRGVANDLSAAFDGREAVMARGDAPSPR
jgi:hypothetical protein